MYSLMLLSRRDGGPRHERWRRAAVRALPPALPLLLVDPVVPHYEARFLGWIRESVAGGLRALDDGTPTCLDDGSGFYQPSRAQASASAQARTLTEGDRRARSALLVCLREAYDALFDGIWDQVRAQHHTEIARQSRSLALTGVGATLASLAPGLEWVDSTLEFGTHAAADVRLAGSGLVVLPSAVWDGSPRLIRRPCRCPVLIYSTGRRLLPLAGDEVSDPLIPVLGQARAGILRALTTELTSGRIAALVGLSPASVSEHISALRDANLLTTRRDGRVSWHRLTLLGADLVAGSALRITSSGV
jgi:DNA-binding transcriptional ArsR family regulator